MPTIDQVRELPEAQMRDLVCELIPALNEARMFAAHAKLQHSLLSIETAEATQRALVEHEMTRREIEVLQATYPSLRNQPIFNLDSDSQEASIHRMLDEAMKRNHQLETEAAQLQRRLKHAKKVIRNLDGDNVQLAEDNILLRSRIRENREHINALRAKTLGGIVEKVQYQASTPRREKHGLPRTPRVDSQNAFDALLIAGQVLIADPSSVPSTPTNAPLPASHFGHVRGAQSLSSLPTTPDRPRPLTADHFKNTPLSQMIPASLETFSAPSTQIPQSEIRRREDRDSTISASEDEAFTDDDLPVSQASRAASNMLRKEPVFRQDRVKEQGVQGRLVQTKLSGKIIKSGNEVNNSIGTGRSGRFNKRAKLVHEEEKLGSRHSTWFDAKS